MTAGMGRRKSVWLDLPPRMTARRLRGGTVLFYYQAAGKKTPLGADKIAAQQEWARLEAGSSKAFPAIAAMYRAVMLPGLALSTRRHYDTALQNLELAFRKWTLEQIEPADVKGYMRRRSKKKAAAFEKRVLSAVFNWARGEGHTSAPNPCLGITFGKAERKAYAPGRRERYVSDQEFDEVYARGDDVLRDAMDLAYCTGQRPSDLLPLTRHDVKDGVLWVTQQKTGKRMGFRVEGDLQRALERILTRPRKVPSMYLIADRRGQRVLYDALNKRFRAARGAGDWQFRDIRAKAASDSPDLKRAQELLGHASEVITAGVYRRSKGAVVSPLSR